MATVNVRYVGPIRQAAGVDTEDVIHSEGATLKALLDLLCESHGEAMRDGLFTSEGWIRSDVIIQVNGKNIDQLDGLETKIDCSNVWIAVIPVVHGG